MTVNVIAVSFAGYSNVGHTIQGVYHDIPYHGSAYHAGRQIAGGGAQVSTIRSGDAAAQFRSSLYNTTNLRIMCAFPSRGDGTNWTATSTAASSSDSFDVNNLNTDIVEQRWQGVDASLTGQNLDCDTGVGSQVFIDTLAIINHNLTTSATVTLIGADNPGYNPIATTTILTIENNTDFVYIAPDIPVTGHRYWRLAIDDATNPDNFLSVGTIVFGPAIIFSNNECFVDTVRKTPVNFTDSINTEGFTNVQNDRGIKNKVRLEFRNILFGGPNFSILNDQVFLTAKTILKCLWVPTPSFPLRFMTFAKMTRIPEQIHNVRTADMDYVNFVIETDESK